MQLHSIFGWFFGECVPWTWECDAIFKCTSYLDFGVDCWYLRDGCTISKWNSFELFWLYLTSEASRYQLVSNKCEAFLRLGL